MHSLEVESASLPPVALVITDERFPADEPGTFFYDFVVHQPIEVSSRFGLILGDALQNLRNALELIVWRRYWELRVRPSGQVGFPICDTSERFERSRTTRLRGLPDTEIERFEAHQPFASSELQPLSELRDLAVIDKHQTIVVTPWAAGFAGTRLQEVRGCEKAELHMLEGGIVEVGVPMIRIKVWGPRADFGASLALDWQPFVAILGIGRADQHLTAMANAVERVVDDFVSV
jgi:hypothetical protein